MTVVAGISAKGAPGVSLAMWTITHLWPRTVIGMELDEAGGTWALRHGLTSEPGLASLASTPDLLTRPVAVEHAHEIGPDRYVVCAPREGSVVTSALAWLDGRLRAWPSGDDLLLDVGRTRAGAVRESAAIERADTLLLFARPRPEDLGPLANLLAEVSAVSAPSRSLQLVLVGSSPYRPEDALDAVRELAGIDQITLGAVLPDDPVSARLIEHGGRKATKVAASWFSGLVDELAAASAHRPFAHVEAGV